MMCDLFHSFGLSMSFNSVHFNESERHEHFNDNNQWYSVIAHDVRYSAMFDISRTPTEGL